MECFTSDHFPIYCNFSLSLSSKYYKKLHYRKLSGINKVAFKNDVKNIIGNTNTRGNFKNTYLDLKQQLNSLTDAYAPFVTKKISIVANAPWFDKEYRHIRSKRRAAEKK